MAAIASLTLPEQQLARLRHLKRRLTEEPLAPGLSTWDSILGQVREIEPDVIGLDVFDTLLMRRVVSDSAAETIVASRMVSSGLWSGTLESFRSARRTVFQIDPNGSLQEWLAADGFADLTSVDQGLSLELAVENELLEAVPGAISAIESLRSMARLVFVSDMHHSSHTIGELLRGAGIAVEDDEIVVSCEAKASKSEGTLFKEAPWAKNEPGDLAGGNAEAKVVFIGNNLWSDVTMAESSGARAVPALAANPTRFETAMAAIPGGPGPILAGASRRARLGALNAELVRSRSVETLLPMPEREYRALLVDGSQVIGPMMVAFLLWVREVCEAEGIHHVEFLARDGELPLLMAKAMPPDHWDGLTLDYLQCGRRAWSLAAAPLVGVREWIAVGSASHDAFLLHSAEHIPFTSLLQRCGLEVADLPYDNPLSSIRGSDILTTGQGERWAKLLDSGELDEVIVNRAQKPMDLILDSLRQRNLPDAPIALVDVGWRGQQAWMISALITEVTGHEPVHLHFGGDGVTAAMDSKVDIRRFALDDSVSPHPIEGPVSCLELFLATGKKRLIGYERQEDGKVQEVFSDAATAVDSATRRALADGAIAMAAAMASRSEMSKWVHSSGSLVPEVRELLEMFWNHSTAAEVRRLGGMFFESDDGGDSVGSVILPYHLSELAGRASLPRQWRHGSLAVTPKPFKFLMEGFFGARNRFGR